MPSLKPLLLGFLTSLLLHVFAGFLLFHVDPAITPSPQISIEYRKGSSPSAPHKVESPRKPPSLALAKTTAKVENPSPSGGEATTMDSEAIENSPIAGSELGLSIEYPHLSRVLGEEGRVTIEWRKNDSGAIPRTKVFISSGHPRLDQAALAAVQNGIEKGILTNFLKSRQLLRISFAFQLTEEKKIK